MLSSLWIGIIAECVKTSLAPAVHTRNAGFHFYSVGLGEHVPIQLGRKLIDNLIEPVAEEGYNFWGAQFKFI